MRFPKQTVNLWLNKDEIQPEVKINDLICKILFNQPSVILKVWLKCFIDYLLHIEILKNSSYEYFQSRYQCLKKEANII